MMNKVYGFFLPVVLLFQLVTNNISAQNIITIAGNGTAGYAGDSGPATTAELNYARGVAIDGSGNIYIADYLNNRIRVVNSAGIISTFAGNGVPGYSGDGGPATAAEILYPAGIATDVSGNVYIVDNGNNCIRKVDLSGTITTFAGNAIPGYSGDGGPATTAELNQPFGVVADASGNIYIADHDNNRVRCVNISGNITTIAGNGVGGFFGDGGPATAAELNGPYGLGKDASGNIYIADDFNNRIRVVDGSGIINTFAGNGSYSYSGDGGPASLASLNGIYGIAADAYGNVYISDINNNRIRIVNSIGTINTFAGNGTAGYSGDGGPATAAELNQPYGVTVDASGNVYVADLNNMRVREISSNLTNAIKIPGGIQQISVSPNPFSGNINVAVNTNGPVTVTVFNTLGEQVGSWHMEQGQHVINAQSIPTGVYMMQVKTKDVVLNRKLIKVN